MATKKTSTGTNLDKLKQAFDASKGSGGGNYNWWRPDWGDNVVRVLPSVDPDGLFFHETARHRINGEWFYCSKYDVDDETGRGKSCPICDARTRLFRSGDGDLIKIAKELKARKQYLMNIVDRKGEGDSTVNVFAAGVKIWNKMVTTMLDDEIDITDVEEGYDFLIKKEEGPKTEFGQFPSYDNSKAKRKATPLHEDPKVAKQILDNRNDLTAIPTFDDESILQASVDNYIKSLTEAPSDGVFYEEEKASESAPKASSKAKGDISSFKDKLAAQLRSDEEDDDE